MLLLKKSIYFLICIANKIDPKAAKALTVQEPGEGEEENKFRKISITSWCEIQIYQRGIRKPKDVNASLDLGDLRQIWKPFLYRLVVYTITTFITDIKNILVHILQSRCGHPSAVGSSSNLDIYCPICAKEIRRKNTNGRD